MKFGSPLPLRKQPKNPPDSSISTSIKIDRDPYMKTYQSWIPQYPALYLTLRNLNSFSTGWQVTNLHLQTSKTALLLLDSIQSLLSDEPFVLFAQAQIVACMQRSQNLSSTCIDYSPSFKLRNIISASRLTIPIFHRTISPISNVSLYTPVNTSVHSWIILTV